MVMSIVMGTVMSMAKCEIISASERLCVSWRLDKIGGRGLKD
jgi:hypothetical protein